MCVRPSAFRALASQSLRFRFSAFCSLSAFLCASFCHSFCLFLCLSLFVFHVFLFACSFLPSRFGIRLRMRMNSERKRGWTSVSVCVFVCVFVFLCFFVCFSFAFRFVFFACFFETVWKNGRNAENGGGSAGPEACMLLICPVRCPDGPRSGRMTGGSCLPVCLRVPAATRSVRKTREIREKTRKWKKTGAYASGSGSRRLSD